MQNFGGYNMWLAAENGMSLRLTTGEWMTTMPENLNMDWVDSVKVYILSQKMLISSLWGPLDPKLLMTIHDSSMFSSILRKEHHELIMSFEKLLSYGITSMQVLLINI